MEAVRDPDSRCRESIERAAAGHQAALLRLCDNRAKAKGGRVPKCPPEKERAMEEALRHFRMIP